MTYNKKKGFTLIELLIVVVIVGILALAAIPLISSNTEEARSSEARAALGAVKDRARVVYARSAAGPFATFVNLGVGATELAGTYFTAAAYTITGTTAAAFAVTCAAVYGTAPVNLIITSNLGTGSSSFNR